MRKLFSPIIYALLTTAALAKGLYGQIHVGNWSGGAFTNDATGKFSGCSSERQRMRRAAAKAAAQTDPAAQANRIRKSVEIWSKKVAILRTQNWFDAEQRQFLAQISAQLAGGEPLTAEQRNRVQSLLMKSQIREQKRRSAESPAPKAGSHWAW
jgi:hypothetical protein